MVSPVVRLLPFWNNFGCNAALQRVATMAALKSQTAKPYTMPRNKTLQFCTMVESASKMMSTAQKERLSSAADLLMSGDKSVVKKNELIVTSRTVGKDHPFTFKSVHNDLPLPDAVTKVPMVVEVIFKEGVADKLFVRVKNDLDCYDGVTATHTGFQVLEYMEHGTTDQVTPFPYTGVNGSPDGYNSPGRALRFITQLLTVLLNVVLSLFSSAFWRGTFRPGPFQSKIEASCKGTRTCRRYNKIPESTKFSDIIATVDAVKSALTLKYYAVTVNFSPTVALALVLTTAELTKRDARLGYLTLPPAGTGPPPAMDAAHSAMLFNCLFYNNYGRHNPNISGKVTDFLWDWMGLFDTFSTFTHCVEIQGRKFVRWCAHPDEWKKIEATGQLSKLGVGEAFSPVPFYSKGK